MFVGEAPGAVDNPELRNLVFVGNKSSDLMLDIIYDLWPNGYDDVYLTNVVKCNPPGNRQPTENEVECCSKFLREEIRMVNPIFIVALGRTAANWFGVTSNLNEARLTPHLWESRRLFVLYHPAYVLRLGPKAVSQFRGQMKVIRNHLIDLEIRCEEK
jgi:DNA polymerase